MAGLTCRYWIDIHKFCENQLLEIKKKNEYNENVLYAFLNIGVWILHIGPTTIEVSIKNISQNFDIRKAISNIMSSCFNIW